MSSDQAEVCAADVVVFGEVTQNYPSKELASKAACTWAKIDDPNKLVLYTSRVGPYKGWVVGVGITRPSGTIEDIVRVDSDDKTGAATKGIHFNAKNSKDSSQTLAAVIEPTKALTPAARDKQYKKILESIKGQEPRVIWLWWSTGAGRFAELDLEDASEEAA